MRLKFSLLVLAVLAAVAAMVGGSGSAPAGAAAAGAERFRTALSAPLGGVQGLADEACHLSWRPGTPGVVGTTVDVPAGVRHLSAALGGAKGDWDLAVFDSTGTAVVSSAETDSRESALGWSAVGGTLRVQACRMSGTAGAVPVEVASAAPVVDERALTDPPQLVSVRTPTKEAKDRLMALGLDLTEHGSAKAVGVVLHGADDRAALRRAGLSWDVLTKNLIADGIAARATEQRMISRRQADAPVLPSGRTGTYRTLADYNAEMKELAEKNPEIVKLFKMPNQTFLGKDVYGLEIAEDVEAQDGRPAFFNMGVHHAREWPAGEMPMEWAHELVTSYKAGNARTIKIMKGTRNIVVPIVNPDGFEASRTAGGLSPINGGAGNPDEIEDTALAVAGAAYGGEFRRKNCRVFDTDVSNCLTSPGLVAENGTDPNRNYGQFWGGPGAESTPNGLSYHGPAPFSEPETRNIKAVVSRNHVTTLITNHTTAALVLRAPGLATLGDPVDENKGYKALGDAMAKENGYFSQKGFELYDTTGTTEDWSYNATGGFGFTFEIYCGAPNYSTGDCDDPSFHPTYKTGVEREWNGDNPTADHTNDPSGKYDGGGNREAYYIAAESTLNSKRHSVIEGRAPANATLRLTKEFKTEAFAEGDEEPITTPDKLETVYKVGANGKYEWHVNPSTRPLVAKDRGKANAGPPSPEEVTTGGPQGSSETEDGADDGAATPDPANDPNPPSTNYNDHPFTIPATGDNATLDIAVTWNTPASDWDVFLYEDTDGSGTSDPAKDKQVGTSAGGPTSSEFLSLPLDDASKGKKYVLRVVNFAALEPYTVTKTYVAPEPFVAGKKERYTATCEVGGKVLQTEQVLVERGERLKLDWAKCGALIGGGNTPGAKCKATKGFKSVAVKPRKDGSALLDFEKLAGVAKPVRIDIFKPGTATKVLKTRKVQRFDATQKPIVWDGRDKKGKTAGPGYYFVRFLVKKAKGVDVRRIALQRKGGAFKVLKDFDRPDTCSALRRFKLSGPVFGGTTDKPLVVNIRLGADARIEGTINKGKKVINRFSRTLSKGTKYNVRRPSEGLAKGDYTVAVRVTPKGGDPITVTGVSRKI